MTVGLLNQERGNSIQRAVAANERPESPDLELPVLVEGGSIKEGGSVRLSDLRGTPVVLNFWASWCVPCRTEAPVLERLWLRYRDQGLLVLGVDVQDLTGKAKAFDEQFGLTYPSVRDGDDSTMRDFEVTGVPETFVIDRQGRVAALRVGPVTAEEQLAEAIEAVL
jgi:cytochrome c biogenesis protein CcmG/thiol:disulfide interchange protein DsbE